MNNERLTDKLGLDGYFTRPYASWPGRKHQRPASAFFPKGTNLSRIGRDHPQHVIQARVQEAIDRARRKREERAARRAAA
jgi:IS30 family transposase